MSEKTRPHLRDCPFCSTKGSEDTKVLFTAETDVVDGFEYSYSIRCTGCGVEVCDEYSEEVVRIWNGEPVPSDEEEA